MNGLDPSFRYFMLFLDITIDGTRIFAPGGYYFWLRRREKTESRTFPSAIDSDVTLRGYYRVYNSVRTVDSSLTSSLPAGLISDPWTTDIVPCIGFYDTIDITSTSALPAAISCHFTGLVWLLFPLGCQASSHRQFSLLL